MHRVVISVHGLNTRGVWQKDLVPLLALDGFVPYALDYGYFVLGFLVGSARDRKVEWLRNEYNRVTAEARCRRPSIIAHSFGTYIAAKLLWKYPEITFDKVIFCGSIVHPCFDWPSVLQRGQVNVVRNDYGRLDPWPSLSSKIVRDSGRSGSSGFCKVHENLISREFPQHRHSDYFHRRHFTDYWLPTLRRTVLNSEDAGIIVGLLSKVVRAASQRLGVGVDLLRCNVFLQEQPERLVISKGLHYHMDDPNELTVSLGTGEGCTGKAFADRKTTIAVLGGTWGEHDIPDSELAKASSRLKWIVSTPIPDPDTPGAVLGVLNLDGLDVGKERNDLEILAGDLVAAAQGVAVMLKRAT
jgi:pimeloyl-ACP methyl ester carboxylesterase